MEDPKSWWDLLEYNGSRYQSFEEAAIARGLFVDNEIWKRTLEEAFLTKKKASQRIRWLAVFFASANLRHPEELLDYILDLPENWLFGTKVASRSKEERKSYVLRSIEWFLRAHGVMPDDEPDMDGRQKSSCEKVGLPRPADLTINTNDLLRVNSFTNISY